MAKKGFKSVTISLNCNTLVEGLIERLSQDIPGTTTLSKSAVIELCVKDYVKKLDGGESS